MSVQETFLLLQNTDLHKWKTCPHWIELRIYHINLYISAHECCNKTEPRLDNLSEEEPFVKNWTLQTGDESWSEKVWNNSVQLDGQLNTVCLCESVASVCRYLWQWTTGPFFPRRSTAGASVSAGHGVVTGNSSDWETNRNFSIRVHASKTSSRNVWILHHRSTRERKSLKWTSCEQPWTGCERSPLAWSC